MPTIAAKIQIYTNENEAEYLMMTAKAYQRACNFLSEKVFISKELNQVTVNNLYYKDLRNLFSLKSQMAQSVMKTVISRYKAAKSNGHNWSLIRFKRPQYDLVWNRDYSLNKNLFSVNTLDGRIKLRFEKKGMGHFFQDDWKFGTAKLVFRQKKWFLHIPMTKEIPDLALSEIHHVVGIDLGINFLATSYDSKGKTTFHTGRKMKHKRGQYKVLRKQLQLRHTPSARKRLKQIGSRENRYVTDINHQVTKALVEQHPKGTLFVIEDLSRVRQSTERVHVRNRYVSVSWAFYQFRKMLEYKALLNGQKVVSVDPKYTSQTCPKCGHIKKANRNKKNHTFCCQNCQYRSNDDRIGAMNLYRKGIEFLDTVTAKV